MISHDSSDLVLRKQLIEQQAGGSAATKNDSSRISSQRLDSKRRAAQNDSASVLQTFSPMYQKIKNGKLKDQIPQSQTSTSPNHGLA